MNYGNIFRSLVFVAVLSGNACAWADSRLDTLFVMCRLQDNGDAHIIEKRVMHIDEEGSELYIPISNLNGSQIKDLRVFDEGSTEMYKNIGEWDENASAEEKTNKCGIITKSDDSYEICWGIGHRGERSYYSADVLEDLRSFYAQTTERVLKRNFDSASRLVHEANRVFIFASGYVQSNVAQELKRLFFYDNVLIYEISGQEEFTSISKGLTPDDLFIFVSLSGETPTVVDFARQLRLLDVPFISITKLHDNTLASLSTVNLYVSPARFQLYDADDERTAFQSMLPYFMLVEVWYVKYRMYLQNKVDRG